MLDHIDITKAPYGAPVADGPSCLTDAGPVIERSVNDAAGEVASLACCLLP